MAGHQGPPGGSFLFFVPTRSPGFYPVVLDIGQFALRKNGLEAVDRTVIREDPEPELVAWLLYGADVLEAGFDPDRLNNRASLNVIN